MRIANTAKAFLSVPMERFSLKLMKEVQVWQIEYGLVIMLIVLGTTKEYCVYYAYDSF